jgi:thiamine monophosphate synthase
MEPADWAREAVAGGVDLIQVREKDLNESEMMEFAAQVLEGVSDGNFAASNESRGSDPGLTTEELFQSSHVAQSRRDFVLLSPVTLVPGSPARTQVQINNSPNIARLLGCGLHLPESVPIPPNPAHPLSRSIHSTQAAINSPGADFLVAGHIFATPSKSETAPRGLEWLASIASAVEIPVVAIGGITSKNAAACIAHGASGIAVIGAIAASPDPRKSALLLRDELDRAWEQRHD